MLNVALNEAGVRPERPGQRVLEIGCGWGGLAEIAAAEHCAHITGVTLSTEQLAWAQARMARAGLSERADLRLQDYRDIRDQPFDAIVSIEMFEAVGREYWAGYFDTFKRCLKPGGGLLHVHMNVEEERIEAWATATATRFGGKIEHLERVKWYAPRIRHVVLDVRIS